MNPEIRIYVDDDIMYVETRGLGIDGPTGIDTSGYAKSNAVRLASLIKHLISIPKDKQESIVVKVECRGVQLDDGINEWGKYW